MNKPLKILLIEDMPNSTELIKISLRGLNANITHVNTGKAALENMFFFNKFIYYFYFLMIMSYTKLDISVYILSIIVILIY